MLNSHKSEQHCLRNEFDVGLLGEESLESIQDREVSVGCSTCQTQLLNVGFGS